MRMYRVKLQLKYLISFLVVVMFFPISYAQESVRGRVASSTEEYLPFASVAMLSVNDNIVVTAGVTDTLGYFDLKPNTIPHEYILRVSYLGYYPFEAKYSGSNVGEIILKENDTVLDELVVHPDEMQEFASHNSYRLDPIKSKNYSTFLESLAMIPTLRVTGWRTLSASNGGSVLILLNGVKVDEKDLIVIDKSDVDKVDVYQNPPARFASMGASMVINVITRKNLIGGNVSVDTNNAITRLDGVNILSAAYNINNWRFTAMYDNKLQGSEYMQDEKIQYKFKDVDYTKEKIGEKSPFRRYQNNFKLGLMKVWDSDLQFNATGGVSLFNEKEEYAQRVISNHSEELSAFFPSREKWHSYFLDLYLAKQFRKKHELLFNLTGTIFDTHLNTSYREDYQNGNPFFEQQSIIDGKKKSVNADIQYTYFADKATYKIGARDNLSFNKQYLTLDKISISTSKFNTLNIYGDASARFGAWQLYGSIGLQQVNFDSPELNQSFSFFALKPDLRLYYIPSSKLWLFAFYRLDNITPSVSMLTETPILKDYYYAFEGNSRLKPYRKNNAIFGGTYQNKYVSATFNLNYSFAKDAILPYFEERDDFLVETYKNMPMQRDFLTAWQINVMPLGNPTLSLMSYGNYNRGVIEGPTESWSNNYLRYFFQVSVNTRWWSGMALYQSAGNSMRGQWLYKHPQATMAEVNYKTDFGLNIGIGGKYLFTKEYKDGQKTHPSALVQIDRWNRSKMTANTFYIKLSYNFSFGKSGKGKTQKLRNVDSDTGVLTK